MSVLLGEKKDMLTIQDAVPCSICGELPIFQGGTRSGRLVCPNYKSNKILHGNLSRKNLPMGFTEWNHYFWSEEQSRNEGIPIAVKEWNSIHA